MEESICLDDDILSPQSENVPPTSPLAAFTEDHTEPDIHDSSVKLETSPTLESICLTSAVSTSDLLDEESTLTKICTDTISLEKEAATEADLGICFTDNTEASPSTSLANVIIEDEIADLSLTLSHPQGEADTVLVDPGTTHIPIGDAVDVSGLLEGVGSGEPVVDSSDLHEGVVDSLEVENEEATTSATISSYFTQHAQSTGQSEVAGSFFDDLAVGPVAVEGTQAKQPEAEVEDEAWTIRDRIPPQDTEDNKSSVHKPRSRLMSSSSTTETQNVTLAESKGQGLQLMGSMQNVSQFFTEDASSCDAEGKSFFDTFTAAEDDGIKPKPDSAGGAAVSSSVPLSSTTLPGSLGSASMAGSPHPGSPLHAILPRSRNNSQTQHASLPAGRTVSQPAVPPVSQMSSASVPAETAASVKNVFQGGSDDPFLASLNMSDMDRRNDAWIPSDMTRQTLVGVLSAPAGTYFPEPDHMTMPGVIIDDPMGDPVRELVQKYMGETEASKRYTLTMGDVPQNEEGLRKLISAECYRSAIDLTGILLSQVGQGPGKLGAATKHTPYTLQLWFTRLALQMKLRLYSHAESESQAFGSLDRPDLFFEYYPESYPGRRGSMVPFEMRVILGELPAFLGKAQDSLDLLHYTLSVVATILSNMQAGRAEEGSAVQLSAESRAASVKLWQRRHARVEYAIGNCLLHIKDYQTAVTVFEGLLGKPCGDEASLLCGIGRIYLQMGDVRTAENYFNKSHAVGGDTPRDRCRQLMNKGFVSLGNNQFSEAQKYFEEAVKLEPTNAVAVNNMAVCWLYMGKLGDALSTLETLIHTDPQNFLQEGLLFNLCTLYELESSRAIHKKQTLLDLVAKYKGNGFNTACLKIQ